MSIKLRVLVVGCGHMGKSHARAYHNLSPDFTIVGLVARGPASRGKLNAELGGSYAEFADYYQALAQTKPDVVCISTYVETHAPYALAALEAGAHVFSGNKGCLILALKYFLFPFVELINKLADSNLFNSCRIEFVESPNSLSIFLK